jgi:transposase InsO family protein
LTTAARPLVNPTMSSRPNGAMQRMDSSTTSRQSRLATRTAPNPIGSRRWPAGHVKMPPMRLEALQADLDAWLREYNEGRPHQGRWCDGTTPLQTFLDTVPVARGKLLAVA